MFPPLASQCAALPRPRDKKARASPATLPPWGWLEWSLIVQAALPGLLFFPGVSPLFRLFTRTACYGILLIAWVAVWRTGRRLPRGSATFSSARWLVACGVWLGLSFFHPTINSVESGAAQLLMYVSVFSPAFWVPLVFRSRRQIPRLMMIVFACNSVSTLMGIGQVYHAESFNPPSIFALATNDPYAIGALTYATEDGRRIVRPCGLSDNPGQAGVAGMVVCLIGLCLATRPFAAWKRLVSLGLAFAGMAMIYWCQIRTLMIMELVCIITVVLLFVARGHLRQAALLVVGIGAVLFGAAAWAVSAVGDVSTKRFMTLIEERPEDLYHRSRGIFVQEAFEVLIWEYPLGAGLGRWGQAWRYFGDHSPEALQTSGLIWVEVQWPGWVVDGGAPLVVCYVVAVALAMMNSVRSVLSFRDRELAYWGAIIVAMNLATLATIFSQCPFVGNGGAMFWMMAGLLHASGEHERAGRVMAPRTGRRR